MSAPKILIIEDDQDLGEELKEALEYEGYSAEYVCDAHKGEERMRSENFDIILLDYKMPVLSGLDILKNLKRDGLKRNILVVTGRPYIENALAEAGLSGNVSGIITKPIDFSMLLKKIEGHPA